MRLLSVFLLLSALAGAGPKKKAWQDEMHPRAQDAPLEIVFTPWYCAQCVKEKRIEPPATPPRITMMRAPIQELADLLDLDKGWVCIQTPHFRILSSLKRTTVKLKDSVFARADLERLKTIFRRLTIGREGATLNRHQRAHIYHIRAERIYSHFAALTDNKKKYLGMEARYQLYLFDDYNEQHTLVDRFMGRVNDKAGLQHHDKVKPNFMVFTTCESQVARNNGKGDKIFANHVIHSVAHNLVDGSDNYYRETWAWLEEGLGHYYERRENPRFNTFCWAEGRSPDVLHKPDWKSTIFSWVRRKKDTPLNRWCEKLRPGELSGLEQGLCWSIVKWMVETEPIRFTKMLSRVDDLKAKPSAAECIQYGFGVTPSVLHVRWREYVLEHYKKR